MSDSHIDPSLSVVDSHDEYPHVTQADLDRARFRVGLGLAGDEVEIEHIRLAHSDKLRLILDEAEARIWATGGVKHEDFWRHLDAGYQTENHQAPWMPDE